MLADTYMVSRPFSGASREEFIMSAIGVSHCKEKVQVFVTIAADIVR